MKTQESKSTPKMEEATAAPLTQRTLDDAARSIGLGTLTLIRGRKERECQVAYRDLAAWRRVARQAQQTCAAAARLTGDPTQTNVEATREGVFFFQNGFPECVARERNRVPKPRT